ncbi:hypothetical protein J6590_058409 [Homalodisca vitripennis]|nr:hypothetical protein J6590_058409 [Homalodisca vitripennis]
MATPPPAEFFRQKDVTHEYCEITTNSPSLNQCSVRQIISGARAHDKQSSETLCLTLLAFWWYMLNPSPFLLPAVGTKSDNLSPSLIINVGSAAGSQVDGAVGLPSTQPAAVPICRRMCRRHVYVLTPLTVQLSCRDFLCLRSQLQCVLCRR